MSIGLLANEGSRNSVPYDKNVVHALEVSLQDPDYLKTGLPGNGTEILCGRLPAAVNARIHHISEFKELRHLWAVVGETPVVERLNVFVAIEHFPWLFSLLELVTIKSEEPTALAAKGRAGSSAR